MMMKKIYTICLLFYFSICCWAQVGIGTNLPNQSAVLDVDVSTLPSNNKKGMLFPNVILKNNIDQVTVPNPVPGLAVFNTEDNGTGEEKVFKNTLYYWNGTSWQDITTMDIVRRELLPQVFLVLGSFNQAFNRASVSNGTTLQVQYLTDDIKLNTGNRITLANNMFTVNSSGKYEISGTINFNNWTSNSTKISNFVTNLEFIVQKSDNNGGSWVNVAKSITAWGYGTAGNNRSMLISPTVLNLEQGNLVRCVIRKSLGSNLGSGSDPTISSPNGLGFSRILKIQKID